LADNRKGLTNGDIVDLIEQLQIPKSGARAESEILSPST
jgi:hypothetical protein